MTCRLPESGNADSEFYYSIREVEDRQHEELLVRINMSHEELMEHLGLPTARVLAPYPFDPSR